MNSVEGPGVQRPLETIRASKCGHALCLEAEQREEREKSRNALKIQVSLHVEVPLHLSTDLKKVKGCWGAEGPLEP